MGDKIVIGCGYGDEAKGLTVHNLCNPHSLVVRFSGGQQAGHTVIHNGVKHIFSNFGAGTLKGCPTFFTEDTCVYPKTISREWNILKEKGFDAKLFIHPHAKVTTPYDVWAGRGREKDNKHGSCGLGIGATMKRNEGPVKLMAIDLLAPRKFLEKRLETISRYYPGAEPSADDMREFWEAVENPKFQVKQIRDTVYHTDIVFEGSQGILLDMDHGIFPNVTYANTICKNALKYASERTDMFYVTRCYSTRHGNGWFDAPPIDLINNEEEINKYNEWQGEFKVGELDYDLLNYAIDVDMSYHNFHVNLVMSCLDQRPDFKLDRKKLNIANNRSYAVFGNDSPHSGNMKVLK